MATPDFEHAGQYRGKPIYCDPEKTGRPLLERLRVLAAYVSLLQTPGFVFAHHYEAKRRDDGVIVMGATELSSPSRRLLEDVYAYGWVTDFDWMDWCGSREAHDLEHQPEALAQADVDQLSCLLTLVPRRDRFVEGSFARDLKNGLVTRILQRGEALARKIKSNVHLGAGEG